MAKQWKQSLEQSDILSDGTPFDGSNIDAPISSVGGVDWSTKTPASSRVPSSSATIISGSGYLVNVYNEDGTGDDIEISVTVDGTDVVRNSPKIGRAGSIAHLALFPQRFETELKVKINTTGGDEAGVSYVLD